MYDTWLDLFDLVLAPFYVALVYLIGNYYTKKNIKTKPYYKYLVPGLMCKVIGGIAVCLIYTFYYTSGGDVTNYFISARTFSNVLLEGHFEKLFELLDYKNNNIHEILTYNNVYGDFMFSQNDHYAIFTVLLTVPFCLLGGKSMVATTILLAGFCFIGLWKLYLVFIAEFPNLTKQFAIAIFFIPSVFFWGSGILKDTYTLGAVGFFIHGLYYFQIKKQRKLKFLLMIILSSIMFINIKPYFLFALLPGSLIWIFFNRFAKIQNQVLKVLAIPFLLISLSVLVVGALQFFGQYLGEYSLDNVLQKAVKTQRDLIRGVQYGENNYDIGPFEPTIPGILSKVPAALNMAMFRPYIWNSRNPVMLLSGMENLFTLCFTLYILIRVKFKTLVKSIFTHPLLVFSLLFAIFFAFSVGLTTANYGAIVRLKIPFVPFYLCSLFILYHLNKDKLGLKTR